jgi:DNA modification methylase
MQVVLQGDCVETLRAFPDACVDSIVTDPPYELGFMGKKWDASGIAFSVELWSEVLRVLKPGGHMLAFSGTRTYHRMVCAIEDAGFEIRDQLAWMYGSGFPKSLDVSKAIDKAAGAEREVVGTHPNPAGNKPGTHALNMGVHGMPSTADLTAPATDEAKQWQGWGTALKPAQEPIVLARKPLNGTVARNVLEHGTGGLNVDGCRIGSSGGTKATNFGETTGHMFGGGRGKPKNEIETLDAGRWPANVILDEAAGALLGEPARFFYCPKASRAEREAGLEGMPLQSAGELTGGRKEGSAGLDNPRAGAGRTSSGRANTHPTVKPIALMRYLCRLITPPGGTVLDPFTGSGTTGIAAKLEGFDFVGCEMQPEYVELANRRIAHYEAA